MAKFIKLQRTNYDNPSLINVDTISTVEVYNTGVKITFIVTKENSSKISPMVHYYNEGFNYVSDLLQSVK
jgi:hypothetical protein